MSFYLEISLFTLTFITVVFFSVIRLVLFSARTWVLIEDENPTAVHIKPYIEEVFGNENFWRCSVITSALSMAGFFGVFLLFIQQLETAFEYHLPFTLKTILTIVLFLTFGEILPRMLAIKFENVFVEIGYFVLKFLQKPLYPFVFTIYLFEWMLKKVLPVVKQPSIDIGQIDLAQMQFKALTLQHEESQILTNVLELRTKPVRKIMTNRNDIVCITASNTFNHVLAKISETGFSRFPFYEKDIDNIIGIVYAKNLVQFLPKRSGKIDWKRFSRKPIFIPETLHLDDVLDIFQSNQIHIAIVVDEYGSVAGLVTLDDIVEELLEDLAIDMKANSGLFKKTSDSTYWFSGATSIEELADVIQIEFPKATSADTVSGFILSLTGDIPKENDTIVYKNHTFTIERVRKNRITSVLVSQNPS